MGVELFEPTQQRIRDLVGIPFVDADVAAGANINAAKIGTGVVTTTEFNFLQNVTSDIQTQLDSKVANPLTTDLDFAGNDALNVGFTQHNEITDPAAGTNSGKYYVKDVGGISKPFFIGDGQAAIDLSTGGGGEVFTWTANHDANGFALEAPKFADATTPTKTLTIDLAGMTTAINGTLDFNFTTAKTITFPDATGNVVVTGLANQIGDTEIAAHISTKITITAKGQLNSNIVYTDQTNTFGAFAQIFPNTQFQLNNPANTFQYIFATSAIITVDKTVTLPLLTANDIFVFEAFIQTLTNKTINTASNTITVNSADVSDLATSTVTFSNKTIDGDVNTIIDINETQMNVSVGASGFVLTSNGVGVAPTYQAAGAASLPVVDTTSIAEGSADATKEVRFEVDGNTTGIIGVIATVFTTAKTVTLPDATDTLMGKATTDIMTNKSIDANGTGNVITNIGDAETEVFTTTKISTTNKSLLNSNIVYIDQSNTFTDTFNQIFHDSDLHILDDNNTFAYKFRTNSLAAERFVDLPALTGNDVFIFANHIATLVNKTLTTPTIVATGFTNMQHTHLAANTGGTLTAAAVTDLNSATITFSNKTIDGDLNTIIDINETQMNVSVGASGTVLTSNGAGVAPTYQTAGGASPPFTDDNSIVEGFTDNTKELRFEVDGNTTAIIGVISTIFTTAKTITIPDATDTLMGKATTDVMTNKSYDLGGIGNVLTGSITEFNTALQADSFFFVSQNISNMATSTSAQFDTANSDDNFMFDGATNVVTGAIQITAGTMRIPLSATPTMAVDGDFAIDTTITDFSMGLIKYFDGEEMAVVAVPIAELTTPADGEAVTYNATTDEFELRTPAGSGDMVLADIQVVTGLKTFNDTRFALRNVADSFSASFVNTITADRILTIPDAAGTIIITGLANQITNTELISGAFAKITGVGTIASGTWEGDIVASAFLDADTMHLGVAQTVTGKKIFGAPAAVGDFAIAGTTSGSTVIDATAVASGVLTIPAATDTLVARDTTDILTNKTMDGDLNTFVDINETQMNVSVGAATTVLTSNGVGSAPTYQTAAGGEFTGAWTANHNNGGSTFALEDALFADPTDDTKQLQIDLAGMTTGIIAILDFNFTTAKTVTFPDATFTVVGKDTTDVFTNKSYDLGGTGNVLTGNTTEFNTALQSESFAFLGAAQTFTALQTFTADATNGGLNVGSNAGEPTGANGQLVYDSTANQMKGFVNGSWVDLGQSGSEVTSWTADHSTNGNSFILTDDASPPAGTVAALYLEAGEMNFNVATGNQFQWRFNDVVQYSASVTAFNFNGNQLNLDSTSVVNLVGNTGGLEYGIGTGDTHDFQIATVSNMVLDIAALDIGVGTAGKNILMTANAGLGYIQMGALTTPLTPVDGFGRYYVKEVSTITTPFFIGDDGIEINLAAGGSGDMILASAQTNSGIKTFLDTTMKLRNVANTFDAFFVNTVTAERIYTLPDVAGTVSLITATESPTNKTFDTTSIFTAADGLTLFTGLGVQAQNLVMNGNSVNLGAAGTVLFSAADTAISEQSSNMFFDVPTTQNFSFDVAGTPELVINGSAVTLATNNLILTAGFLQFSDANTTITDATGILQYDVASTFSHDFRINNTLEAQLTNLIFNLPNAAFQEAGIPISPIGLHDMFADGGSFAPIDSGGLVKRTIGSGINQKAIVVSTFSATVDQYAVTKVTVPENYDGGVITIVVSWTNDTTGTGNVLWAVAAVNVSDGDDLNAAATNFSTNLNLTADAGTTLNFEHKTARSGNVTPANTYVAGDTMYIKVTRLGANASDTFSQTADLLGISVRFGIDAATV